MGLFALDGCNSPFEHLATGLSLFSMVSEIDGKLAVCDDTCYILGFDDQDVTRIVQVILNSQQAQDFMRSICFFGAKRAINKDILMRIDLLSVLKMVDRETIGLGKEEYKKATNYILQHGMAVAAGAAR